MDALKCKGGVGTPMKRMTRVRECSSGGGGREAIIARIKYYYYWLKERD